MDASPQKAIGRPGRSLRRLLAGSLVSFAALLLPTTGAAAEVARPADSFVDSIGVNTHLYYNDTDYYRSFGTVEARLRELGVRHIRENLVPDRQDQYQRLNRLASLGIRPTLILGEPPDGSAGLDDLIEILGTDLRGSVEAVEGPNEWDLRGGGNWVGELAAYQSMLYSRVRSNAATSGLPILGPALGNTNSTGPNVAAALDFGNIHPYPNGEPPERNIARRISEAARMSAGKPLMATETGYHTALNAHADHQPASESAQAIYLPRLFLDYYGHGVARTFSYELLDEFADPGLAEPESNFGLLRKDLSPKPAFLALRNLIAILADPSPPFAPGRLDYSISGDSDDLHQLLLQKSDGTYYLALWREGSVWSTGARTAEAAASAPITLSFAELLDGAAEYAPNVAATPLRGIGGGDALTVEVGPQVKILRLLPSGRRAPNRIKAWVSRRTVPQGGRVAVKGWLPRVLGQRTQVKVQRWIKRRWRTIARGRARPNGRFVKRVRMVGARGRASKIRVIARQAKPSNAVRVRVVKRGRRMAVDPNRKLG